MGVEEWRKYMINHYTHPENNEEPIKMGHHKGVVETGREDCVKLITVLTLESWG